MHEFLTNTLSYFSLSTTTLFFLPKIIVSLICGTIIGLERELVNKTAGMKTLMLVCLGSTLFATLSIFLGNNGQGSDQTRIIAQIVSGIGFLGAGVILQQKGVGVIGMTSAANIWFTGAVGCIIGIGEYELAILLCFISVFFLISFRWFEIKITSRYELSMPHFFSLKIDCDPKNFDNYSEVLNLLKKHKAILKQSSMKKVNGTSKKIDIKYACSSKNHSGLIEELQLVNGIVNFEIEEFSKES